MLVCYIYFVLMIRVVIILVIKQLMTSDLVSFTFFGQYKKYIERIFCKFKLSVKKIGIK